MHAVEVHGQDILVAAVPGGWLFYHFVVVYCRHCCMCKARFAPHVHNSILFAARYSMLLLKVLNNCSMYILFLYMLYIYVSHSRHRCLSPRRHKLVKLSVPSSCSSVAVSHRSLVSDLRRIGDCRMKSDSRQSTICDCDLWLSLP